MERKELQKEINSVFSKAIRAAMENDNHEEARFLSLSWLELDSYFYEAEPHAEPGK